ncbi:RNA polymerase sigma factor [Mesorhizobium sp. M1A.F.Ca.ET.072.01.1.1]|uniref:RNA polymerase sigma factor n=1 Tax=Mesorhizobium sp. M1A.F.Ca.ET.072.01.1.1 TaxID=2496753 RepID=UPI000FD21D17|nr:RNA polymerase sigma factor [Mesorhizobium sp. M1A.F.Ca.ET.072.01.1.1]TIV01095.1 MAG: RNA polymerase sigma factor [Mesorhizobium sp.]
MKSASQAAAVSAAEAGEMALVRRALARDPGAFRFIIKTHNQRLYRIARGVVRNDAEAEDIVQEAYMRAFASLDSFRGDASLSTWLSRIVINEALGRLRKRKRIVAMPENPDAQIIRFPLNSNDLNPGDDPERTMAQRQILGLVERATDSLPDVYRTVFVARVIEGLSIEETADLLGIRPETVKTRLHRARALVRKALDDEIGPVLLDAFPFAGRRCERLTRAVMKRLGFEG